MMETNRTLEYLGLAKCKLQTKSVVKILNQIGRIPFALDQVEAHQAKLKARDAIIEKNKKLKQTKKPEEPVPILDNLEQANIIGSDGHEAPGWVILKNVQFKHVNVCMNEINDEVKETLAQVLRRTNDDFGVTLSGNPVSKETIDQLQRVAYETHLHRVHGDATQVLQQDPLIGLKRISY